MSIKEKAVDKDGKGTEEIFADNRKISEEISVIHINVVIKNRIDIFADTERALYTFKVLNIKI